MVELNTRAGYAGASVLLLAFASCGPAQVREESAASDSEKAAALEEMVQEVRARYPTVQGVTAPEVQALIQTDEVVLVDVRTDAERRVSSIAGAITAEEFEADPTQFADRTVVAFCTVGERSARFARDMAESGVEVLNFEGSLLAWSYADGDLVDADGPTHTLHVYGPTWDLAAGGYQTVW